MRPIPPTRHGGTKVRDDPIASPAALISLLTVPLSRAQWLWPTDIGPSISMEVDLEFIGWEAKAIPLIFDDPLGSHSAEIRRDKGLA
ncbi:hypothetical protein IFM47457_05081 [Aspergillus lentulus]|nr:hypothetical protein IFM47457_05081 [Aspergillus lentulus]